jgi:hypothetical protein
MAIKLKELRNWVNQLPSELDEFNVVNAEFGEFTDGDFMYRLDKPVVTLVVNEDTKEILVLNAPTAKTDENAE